MQKMDASVHTTFPTGFLVADARFLEWRELSDPPRADILRQFFEQTGSVANDQETRISFADLTFYDDITVVAFAVPDAGQDIFFLADQFGSRLRAQLTGNNDPIYRANEEGHLTLGRHSQAAFIRFFFHFVHGTHGSFEIAETPDDIRWADDADEAMKAQAHELLLPLTYRGQTPDGLFVNTATVIFKDALFKTDILVASREIANASFGPGAEPEFMRAGQTRLANEDLLMENLPLKPR